MEHLSILRGQWDRVIGWALVIAAAVFLLVGWLGVSRYGYPAAQLPYIASGALGGIFLLGVSAVILLSADLRDEWRKLDAIEQHLANQARLAAENSTTPPPTANGTVKRPRKRAPAPADVG